MILVNVLAIVAVAAAAVTLMLAAEDPALDRATRLHEAAQALAVARGGELSAAVALRRDTTPASDDRGEWAGVEQAATPIAGGVFSLTVDDVQGRFNVNAAGAGGEPVLAAIVAALGLKGDIASRISGFIAAGGGVADLAELRRAGIDAPTIAALRPLVTALPDTAAVNVNAADAKLLGILVGDPAGRLLAARRDRAGRLTAEDFAVASVALPAGAGFTSDHYRVTTTVTIGATTQTLASLLERRRMAGGVSVAVVARSRDAPGGAAQRSR